MSQDDINVVARKVELLQLELQKDLNIIYNDIDKRLDNIEKVLIVQEANLNEHMRRTEINEERLQRIEDKELKPLVKHVHMVNGGLKFLGILSLFVGMFSALYKIFF